MCVCVCVCVCVCGGGGGGGVWCGVNFRNFADYSYKDFSGHEKNTKTHSSGKKFLIHKNICKKHSNNT